MAAKAAKAAATRSKPAPTAKKAVAAASAAKKPVAKSTTKPAKSTTKKPAARKRSSSGKARTVVGNVVTPAVWGPAQRTDELAKALGGVTALARALGVSPSQPSRWKAGKESPGPEAARKLI